MYFSDAAERIVTISLYGTALPFSILNAINKHYTAGSKTHVHKPTYGPLIDTGPVRNAFDACKWEGVGPWKSRLFWSPNGTRLTARCHFTGLKKVSISRAQSPPTCPRNGCCPHQKHYAQGRINHRCINSYCNFRSLIHHLLCP